MHSQNDEEKIILDFFGDYIGTFLDIGAYDGLEISNTRALLEKGWSGVMVEPDPRSLVKLMENVEPFKDKVKIISAAVIPHHAAELYRLWMDEERAWASGITNFVPAGIDKLKTLKLYVRSISIAQLLMLSPYDFINIDAEGMDMEILRAIPTPLPCKLICIEPYFEKGRIEMRKYLTEDCGCTIIAENKENLIACPKQS